MNESKRPVNATAAAEGGRSPPVAHVGPQMGSGEDEVLDVAGVQEQQFMRFIASRWLGHSHRAESVV